MAAPVAVLEALSSGSGWRARAACRGMDPAVFHPTEPGYQAYDDARAVCAGCPVSAECLDFHLFEPDGFYGGMTPRERRSERERRAQARRRAR